MDTRGRAGGRGIARTAGVLALGALIGYVVVSLVLLGIGMLLMHVLLHGALGKWDVHANAWFAHRRTPWLNDVTSELTRLANTLGVVVVAAIVEVVLLIRRHAREALLLLVGLPVELATFLTVNTLIDRPRPSVPKLDSVPSTASFPSGHIAATLTLYVLIAVCVTRLARSTAWHRIAWTVAVALTLLVGFARVYRGLHHVTDVVAGLILGIGAVVTAYLDVRYEARTADRGVTAPRERSAAAASPRRVPPAHAHALHRRGA